MRMPIARTYALAAIFGLTFTNYGIAEVSTVDNITGQFRKAATKLNYDLDFAFTGCSKGRPRICTYKAGPGTRLLAKSGHEDLNALYDIAVEIDDAGDAESKTVWSRLVETAIELFEPKTASIERTAAVNRLSHVAKTEADSTATIMLNRLRLTTTSRPSRGTITDITRREPYITSLDLGLNAKEFDGKIVRITDCLVMVAGVSSAFCPIVNQNGDVAGVITVQYAENDSSGRRRAVERCASREAKKECLAAVTGTVNADIRSLVSLDKAKIHWNFSAE